MSTIVWFRRDLRLADNPALANALRTGGKIIPVYIYCPAEESPWQPGAASRWYLRQSLSALQADLAVHGLDLRFLQGDSGGALLDLARQTGALRVYWNRIYEPALTARDRRVAQLLRHYRLTVEQHHDQSLLPPGTLLNKAGGSYRVFTPFWKRLAQDLTVGTPAGVLRQGLTKEYGAPMDHDSRELNGLDLLDAHPWHQKLAGHWVAGEAAAREALATFTESLADYPGGRDLPGESRTSKLSAALHFGELSPWRIVEAMRPAMFDEAEAGSAAGAEAFLRQLGWREFAIHSLNSDPDSATRSLRQGFDTGGVWVKHSAHLRSWQRGMTGFPLVDAGMAELWETGWMHNRVRMVVASLLTKNLGCHWLDGARWFWDTLVDADLANNNMGWQWVAGCGCDAAPYHRIFNPHTQAKRFDPEGRYIARWLKNTRLTAPVVDLTASRNAALGRYQGLKHHMGPLT